MFIVALLLSGRLELLSLPEHAVAALGSMLEVPNGSAFFFVADDKEAVPVFDLSSYLLGRLLGDSRNSFNISMSTGYLKYLRRRRRRRKMKDVMKRGKGEGFKKRRYQR
jgi:hypothetical protein